MNSKSLDPAERYGSEAITSIWNYLREVGAESASKALSEALKILLQTKEKSAKITVTFTLQECRQRSGVMMLVNGETQVSGRLKASLESTNQKFFMNAGDPIPGMEGV